MLSRLKSRCNLMTAQACFLLQICAFAWGRSVTSRRDSGNAAGISAQVGNSRQAVQDTPKGFKPRTLFGWGRNNAGQLGLGHTADVNSPEILNTFHGKEIKLVASGGGNEVTSTGGFSLAVAANGALYAFGANDRGQLGVGDLEDRHALVPVGIRTKSPIAKVAAGADFSIAVTQDGRVYSWGANDHGQLGLGDTRDRSLPELISGSLAKHSVHQVSCGAEHVTVVTTNGHIFAWGSNGKGQLGLGSSAPKQLNPVQIQGAVTGIRFTAVESGHHHVLAASKSGEVYCWGANDFGQLGLGDLEPRNAPHALLHKFTRSKIVRVAAGARHSLAVTESGELFSWGSNDCGQLGSEIKGGNKYIGYPHRVESMKVGRIRAGAAVSAAFLESGRAFMWGCNNNGELSLNDVERRTNPHAIPTPGGVAYTQLAPGASHVLAVNRNGDLFGWGRNDRGQLGLAYTTLSEMRPQLIASISSADVEAVATGGFAYEYQAHSLAVTSSGKVFTWGWNAFGQLGLGLLAAGSATPARLFDLEKPVSLHIIECGQYNTGAVVSKKQKSGLKMWGPNFDGQLGYRFNELGPVVSPNDVESLIDTNIVELSLGYQHVLALDAEGTLHVWGGNRYGQLGTGDSRERNRPTVVRAFRGDRVVHVAAGQHCSFAVTEKGEVYAWGYNENFELGLGLGVSRNSPQLVGTLSGKNVTRIVAGGYHALAVTGLGEMYAWGNNVYGQLGLGHFDEVQVPTRVSGMPQLAQPMNPPPSDALLRGNGHEWLFPPAKSVGKIHTGVSGAGTWHSAAIGSDGRLYVWGRNSAGQLGIPQVQLGSSISTPTVVDALGDTHVVGVAVGAAHTLAIGRVGRDWAS
uniref:Regulator of chromosome condensation n=1 Tax=Tetraselmis sp. GSL018 TaxID=582737 RepID=A0A061R4H9_9CHLO